MRRVRTLILLFILALLLFLAAQASGAEPPYANRPDPFADGVGNAQGVHWVGDGVGAPDGYAAVFFGPGSKADYSMGDGEYGTGHLTLHLLGTNEPAELLIVYLRADHTIIDSTEITIAAQSMSEPGQWFVFYGGAEKYAGVRVQVQSGAILLDALEATAWERQPDVWLPIVGVQ